MKSKFDVVFIEEAKKDYQKLNGSVKKLVDIAIAKMLERADELGDELTNKNESNLIGCRKIGVRIVYRIISDKAEIISIGKREEYETYKMLLNA